MSIQEIEAEAKKLPVSELDGLVNRLIDFFHECWDRQIREDADSGRLDALLDEVKEEIRQGRTTPL